MRLLIEPHVRFRLLIAAVLFLLSAIEPFVHAANGDPLATAPARDVATALVLQNELTPVDAH